MDNNKYKDALIGICAEFTTMLKASTRARNDNPTDNNIKLINDIHLGIVKRLKWHTERENITPDTEHNDDIENWLLTLLKQKNNGE